MSHHTISHGVELASEPSPGGVGRGVFVRAAKLLFTAAFIWLIAGAVGLAQVPAPAPAPSGSAIVVQGRSLGFEWIITLVMIGLALFVVCRSSHRN